MDINATIYYHYNFINGYYKTFTEHNKDECFESSI
jgi:hypothetical protein